jgi:hypothetical protein
MSRLSSKVPKLFCTLDEPQPLSTYGGFCLTNPPVVQNKQRLWNVESALLHIKALESYTYFTCFLSFRSLLLLDGHHCIASHSTTIHPLRRCYIIMQQE